MPTETLRPIVALDKHIRGFGKLLGNFHSLEIILQAFLHELPSAPYPVGRVGKPEDIAEACLFLAEQAGFMTGQNLTLDGGMTVKMIYEE